MAEANGDPAEPKKSKTSVKKIFGFGKKKKKSDEDHSVYCPYCAQANATVNPSQSAAEYEEKQRIARIEASRKQAELARPETKPYKSYPEDEEEVCKCTRCRRQRGEDPLTVELLPMDTQVTLQNSLLQNSLQDAGFMCCIL